ncbi:fungal versatile peroxidase from pleurotus Eryngii [Mycena leptocephala]|nr:fungal versatile peroxidase from pleurotus Eryngii [Mycena leptocephala]
MTILASIAFARSNVTANAACCPLFPSLDDLQANLFDDGECGEEKKDVYHAHRGGGADGSVITFDPIETAFPANNNSLPRRHNITLGDLIQFAGAVDVSNCPGVPRLQFLLGRPVATAASPIGLVPEPFVSQRSWFAEVGFSPAEVGCGQVTVLALIHQSHTIAAADHVTLCTPFDSTRGIFDTQLSIETQLRGILVPGFVLSPLEGMIRRETDSKVYSRTACGWQSFATNQAKLQPSFRAAMAKMAVIGQNMKTMIDCSNVIPVPKPVVGKPHLPADKTMKDIEQACTTALFPTLTTDPALRPLSPPFF